MQVFLHIQQRGSKTNFKKTQMCFTQTTPSKLPLESVLFDVNAFNSEQTQQR